MINVGQGRCQWNLATEQNSDGLRKLCCLSENFKIKCLQILADLKAEDYVYSIIKEEEAIVQFCSGEYVLDVSDLFLNFLANELKAYEGWMKTTFPLRIEQCTPFTDDVSFILNLNFSFKREHEKLSIDLYKGMQSLKKYKEAYLLEAIHEELHCRVRCFLLNNKLKELVHRTINKIAAGKKWCKLREKKIAQESILLLQKELTIVYTSPISESPGLACFKSMYLTPFLTLDWKDVPKDLRFKGVDDPSILHLEKVQRLFDWVSKEYALTPKIVSYWDCVTLKTVVDLQKDPKIFQRATSALIAHEFAHLLFDHALEKIEQRVTIERVFYTAFLTYGVVSLTLLLSKGFSPMVGGYLFLFVFWGFLMSKSACWLISKNLERKQEEEADLFAVQKLSKGGECVRLGLEAWQRSFKSVKDDPQLSFYKAFSIKAFVDASGTPLPTYFSHGSFTERILRTYIEQF